MTLRFAINVPSFGAFLDVRFVAELSHVADETGWDGFFVWDHLLFDRGVAVADTTVLLTAIALSTQRLRFGALVTPLPRRRPWKLARELATLDQLSGGRVVLGAGLGDDYFHEYSSVGESTIGRTHAEMADESLQVMTGLWRGEPFSFGGKHYQLDDLLLLPTPVQQPRPPVWAAAHWPGTLAFQRAARWDGVYPARRGGELTAEDCRALLAYTRRFRTTDAPFDVVVNKWTDGLDAGKDRDTVAPFEAAGVTWWQVGFEPDARPEDVLARVKRGPGI